MKTSGAEILIQSLEKLKINIIAGIPGGANLPIYQALSHSSIRHILVRHEQAAGFIAQGMARTSRKPSVCMATSGPGATNLLTALADAKLDMVPVIAITGQVNKNLINTNAFQEVDICSMAAAAVKKTWQIQNASEIPRILYEAYFTSLSGKPGPVLIDIPKDVQMEEVEISEVIFPSPNEFQEIASSSMIFSKFKAEDEFLDIVEEITNSQRPILYIGGGIVHSGSEIELRTFIQKHKIPAVSTLMSLGSLESGDPFYLGMLGMHGSVTANHALEEADLVIVIGARFDDRATGNFDLFCPRAKIIHIDIHPMKEYKGRTIHYSIKSDAKKALLQLNSLLPFINREDWLKLISQIKYDNARLDNLSPNWIRSIIRTTASFMEPEDIIVTDVGQHQMWVAQNFPFKKSGKFLTSGGLGTMGFGLPVSIGAALSNPLQNVICFSGDGSILMNLQELATLSDLDLNIKIIIFNNGHLGLVRQQQHLFFNRRFLGSRFERTPDFQKICEGFGIKAHKIEMDTNTSGLTDKIKSLFVTKGPMLLDIEVNHEDLVLPMVPPGMPNNKMLLLNE